MPAVYLTTPGCHASLVSERLHIEYPDDAQPLASRDIPLHDIDHLVVAARTSLTPSAMAECLTRAIPIVILDRTHHVAGLCQAPALHGQTRLAHYQAYADPAFGLALAATLVEAKIANSRRVLQRLAANRQRPAPEAPLSALSHAGRAALSASSLEALRGCEGTAAARYFDTLATFFPAHTPFERRSRRPPHNPANALLSFGYTLLAGEISAALHASGLDPALGFLHEPDDGRPSLSLDLLEPLRAPIADALALDLLNHQTLHPDRHFDPHDGGIYLNLEGRRRYYVAYERRLERPFTSEQTCERTTLRQEILRQVHSLKRAIRLRDPFEPFLMN